MCESNAFTNKGGKEELVLKDVGMIQQSGDTVFLADILGNKKELKGRIKEIDFIKHKVIIEQ